MTAAGPGPTIGRNVRTEREHQLLSRRGLSELTGVAEVSIDQLERGLVARPRRGTVEKLAKGLGVEFDTLLQESVPPLAEAPSFNQPSLIDEKDRRTLTIAELNAIETMQEKCARLETFLDRSTLGENATLEVWEHFSRDARETAALTLPLAEREPVRSRFFPVAARFVELANRVIDGAREAGVAEQDRAAIHEFEKAVA